MWWEEYNLIICIFLFRVNGRKKTGELPDLESFPGRNRFEPQPGVMVPGQKSKKQTTPEEC